MVTTVRVVERRERTTIPFAVLWLWPPWPTLVAWLPAGLPRSIDSSRMDRYTCMVTQTFVIDSKRCLLVRRIPSPLTFRVPLHESLTPWLVGIMYVGTIRCILEVELSQHRGRQGSVV